MKETAARSLQATRRREALVREVPRPKQARVAPSSRDHACAFLNSTALFCVGSLAQLISDVACSYSLLVFALSALNLAKSAAEGRLVGGARVPAQ
jgi:hypothetical protein